MRVYPESQCAHDTKYGLHLPKCPGDQAALLWSMSPLQDVNADVPEKWYLNRELTTGHSWL